MTKIIKLKASNVKRLQAVEVRPDGAVVVVGGRNAQGKSSVLDSIMYALAGGKAIPAEPIRKGQRRASTTVELDDGMTVVRTYNATGSKLEVMDAHGVKQRSPQKLLDALCGSIAFDPLEYSRMASKQQAQTLRDLIGLDTDELDEQRARKFADRTMANRAVKELRARVKAAPTHPNAPAEEVSIADLAEELERRRERVQDNDLARDGVQLAMADAAECNELVGNTLEAINRAEQQLAEMRADLAEYQEQARVAEDAHAKVKAKVEELVDPDVNEVLEQLRGAEQTNAQVRANAQAKRLEVELDAAESEAQKLTDQIADIDQKKRDLLATAQFPIAGLGFDADGVTLDGVPLEQASQAQRLRLSVAIGLAMNPTLRVLLIRDGSLLDEESLALVAQMAEVADAQVWLEVVTTDSERATVIIEDGQVASD